MNPLKIALWQTDIAWEDKTLNLQRLRQRIASLQGKADLLVMPETFSTGFSMRPDALAESIEGETIRTLAGWARDYGLALAGSYIACETEAHAPTRPPYYNRAFFLTPEGEAYFYDKRHLFRMGGEADAYTPGSTRPLVCYRGWKILLLVCYDLRFPVWSRNRHNEYDLLLYVANWPSSRRMVWDALLKARAIENISYACGVNRIGKDYQGTAHDGGTSAYSFKGEQLAQVPDGEEGIATFALDADALQRFRQRFPAWMDADAFSLA